VYRLDQVVRGEPVAGASHGSAGKGTDRNDTNSPVRRKLSFPHSRSRKLSTGSNKSTGGYQSPQDSVSPYVSESDDERYHSASLSPVRRQRHAQHHGHRPTVVPHVSDFWMCVERVPVKWLDGVSLNTHQNTESDQQHDPDSSSSSNLRSRRFKRSASQSSTRTDVSEAIEETTPLNAKSPPQHDFPQHDDIVSDVDLQQDLAVSDNGPDDESHEDWFDGETEKYVIVAWNNRDAFRRQFQRQGADSTPTPNVVSQLPFTSSCAFLGISKFEFKRQQSLSESNFIENQLKLSLTCHDSPQSTTYLKPRRMGADTILRFKKRSSYGIKLSLLDTSSSVTQQYLSPMASSNMFGNVTQVSPIASATSTYQVHHHSTMNLGDMELICKSLQWRLMTDKSASNTSSSSWNMGKLDALHVQTRGMEYSQFWFDGDNEMCGRTLTDDEKRRIIFRTCFELRGIIRIVFFVDFICTGDHLIYGTRDPLLIDGATFRFSERLRMWKIKSIIRKSSSSMSGSRADGSTLSGLRNQLTCLGFDVMAGLAYKEHRRKVNIANLTYLVHPGQLQIKIAETSLAWNMIGSDASVVVTIPAMQPGHYNVSFFSNGKHIEQKGLVYGILADASDIEPSSPSYDVFEPDESSKRNALNQDVVMQLVIQDEFDKLMSMLMQKESNAFEVDLLQRSAFHLAMILNHPKCAALLLLFGGEEITFHRDLFGMTALEAGRFFGHNATANRIESFWKKYASLSNNGKGDRREFFEAVQRHFSSLSIETPRYKMELNDELTSPVTSSALVTEENPFE